MERLKDSGLIATSSELCIEHFRKNSKVPARHRKRPGVVKRLSFFLSFSGRRLSRIPLALLNLLLQWVLASSVQARVGYVGTYKSPHGAVESMSVVAAELGVSTLERRVSVGLRLLDAVCAIRVSLQNLLCCSRLFSPSVSYRRGGSVSDGDGWGGCAYPFL